MRYTAWLLLTAISGWAQHSDEKLPLTLHDRGVVERELGHYPEAEAYLRQAVAIWEERQPQMQAELASSLQSLASLCLTQGRLSQAETLYRRAYELRRTALGELHPLTGVSLHGLAELLHQRRRYSEADEVMGRAAEILRTALGAASLAVADVSHNRAVLYRDMHRDAEAKALLETAVAIYEKLAPTHPKLAIALRNLAELDPPHADRLFARSLAICDAALPPDHPQTGIILQAYARHLRRSGRKKEARLLDQRARAIVAASARNTGAGATVDVLTLTAK